MVTQPFTCATAVAPILSAGLRPRYADPRYAQGGPSAFGLCFDRDRDGRCDEPWSDGRSIPQTLPEMAAASGLQRGVASYDVERWLRPNLAYEI